MKNLRLYIILDWILVGISYLAGFLLYNGALIYERNSKLGAVMNSSRVSGLVFFGILLFLQLILYIMGLGYGVTAKESMAKHSMIVKLVSLPFYYINFVAFYYLIVDIYNSDKLFSLLMVLFGIIVISSTMFRSSFPNFVYFVRCYIRKKLKVTPWSIISLLMSFILGLDVIAGIILYKHELNQRPDIAARIAREKLRKIEEWKNKKHPSLLSFKIVSIITTILISIASITLVIIISSDFKTLFGSDDAIKNLFGIKIFVFLLVVLFVLSFLKFIFGIRYGKRGEENPTNFLFIIKIVDILPIIAMLATTVLLIALATLTGGAFALLIVFLLPFLVFSIVIIIAIVIGELMLSLFTYASSVSFMMSGLLCIWSTSLSTFTYYINQRRIENRKFASKLVVISLILLWVPVFDIVAMAILRHKAKNNLILGDKPVIVIE